LAAVPVPVDSLTVNPDGTRPVAIGLAAPGGAFDPARLAAWWRIAYLTTGMLVGWLIALVLAFATSPLYSVYAALPHRPDGLSAIADQQIAAGVMWVPGSITFVIVIFVYVHRWLAPAPPLPTGTARLASGH